MRALAVLAVLAAATPALADGFVCTSEDGATTIRVYNHTSASEGTRTGAVMVIADQTVARGNKTVAKFTETKRTLTSKELVYTAQVDLRVKESNRKGENVFGTKLGQIDQIALALDFTYSRPVGDGARLAGITTVEKRNGETLNIEMDCVRYLKNADLE